MNDDVLEITNMMSMYDVLIQRNLRWLGHVHRMEWEITQTNPILSTV